MRAILAICGVTLLAVIVWIAIQFQTPNHYGAVFSNAPKVEVEALLEHPTDFLGKHVTIEGTVADQCPSTGCFFYFYLGPKKLKVELGDLAQKIPRRSGAIAVVEGQLVPFGDSYQFLGTAAEFH